MAGNWQVTPRGRGIPQHSLTLTGRIGWAVDFCTARMCFAPRGLRGAASSITGRRIPAVVAAGKGDRRRLRRLGRFAPYPPAFGGRSTVPGHGRTGQVSQEAVGVAGQVDPRGGLPGSGVLVPEVDVPGLDVQPFVEVADALRLVHHLAVTAVDGVPQLVPGVGLAPVGERRRSGVVLQLGRHPEGHVHLDLLLDSDHDRLSAVHRDPGEGDPALRRSGRHGRHRCEHGRRSTGHRRSPHRLPHPLEPRPLPCSQDRARVGAPARG
ncbi:hypothetical protein SMICM17S_01891 [Streptomyces microflavus]